MQKTHVVMLLDESTSMAPHQQAVVDTFNQYTKELRDNTKRCWLSLFKFAGNTSRFSKSQDMRMAYQGAHLKKVFENRKLKECYPLTTPQYTPNGWTPLYDAIGDLIERTKARLPKKAKVLFVVHTDGQENTSVKHNMESIRALIKKMEEKRGWTFVYLGEGAEAWNAGYDFGIDNVANFSASTRGAAMSNLATATMCYASRGVSGQSMHGLYDAAGVAADVIGDDEKQTYSSTVSNADQQATSDDS